MIPSDFRQPKKHPYQDTFVLFHLFVWFIHIFAYKTFIGILILAPVRVQAHWFRSRQFTYMGYMGNQVMSGVKADRNGITVCNKGSQTGGLSP
jgi:hypothetical protein